MYSYIKKARAHKVKNNVYIQPHSYTTYGLLILDGPIFVSNDEDFHKIGRNILKALDESKYGIPHPTQEEFKKRNFYHPMLTVTGLKNWNALMKASLAVKIDNLDNEVSFTPYRFGGTKGDDKGYHDLEGKVIKSSFDEEELGKSLILAFERCEGPDQG